MFSSSNFRDSSLEGGCGGSSIGWSITKRGACKVAMPKPSAQIFCPKNPARMFFSLQE